MNSRVNDRRRGWLLAAALAGALLLVVVALGSAAAPDAMVMIPLKVTIDTTPDRGRGFRLVRDLLVYELDNLHGGPGSGPGQFNRPRGMARGGYYPEVDYPAYFIVDSGNHRIQLWVEGDYSDLWEERTWGGGGTEPGKFIDPFDVAVDAAGDVYVTDMGKGYVQKFTWDGTYLSSIGSQGTGPGQFRSPTGIGIDKQGRIYVGDRLNHNVQVFDAEGAYLRTLGSGGRGPGYFGNPTGIAFNENGDVYIVDYDLNNVQAFSADGDFLGAWGSAGGGVGQFDHPSGIAVDGRGLLYICDAGGRVQVFDQAGAVIGALMPREGSSVAAEYADIILVWASAIHRFFVTDLTHEGFRALDALDAIDDAYQFRDLLLDDGQRLTYGVRSDSRPVTTTIHTVPLAAGWSVDQVTCDGGSPVQMPYGVRLRLEPDVDVNCTVALSGPSAGLTVGVLDSSAPTLTHRFTLDPAGLRWSQETNWSGLDSSVKGIVVDAAGLSHILVGGENRVRVYDAEGNYLRHWGDGMFMTPNTIALAPNGNFYITHYMPSSVRIFDPAGNYLGSFGGAGTSEGQFDNPCGIDFDALGNVYVADYNNHRIQVFDPTGEFLRMWGWGVLDGSEELQVCTSGCRAGIWGTGEGQPGLPSQLAVDGVGQVYVTGNSRNDIQRFTTEGEYLGLLSDKTTSFWEAPLVTDAGNNLFALGTRLVKFDETGRLMGRAAYRNDYREELDGRDLRGLAIASDGTVIVLVAPWTSGAGYVQLFQQDGPALQHGQTHEYDLATGRYVIDVLKLGEAWPAISCRGGTVETGRGRAIVTLAEGDDATCTFNYGLAPRAYLPSVRR